jgi:hypothetical protein
MKFIINLFGTGIRFWECQIDQDIYDDMNKIRIKHNVDWEKILFDLDFLQHYGFNNWSELSNSDSITGFLLNSSNIIEIKQGVKLVSRFKSNELDHSQVLFPLYNTVNAKKSQTKQTNGVHFKLLQYEKGLIAKLKFEAEIFSINDITFYIDTIQSEIFLSSIYVHSMPLDIVQEDTLIVGTKIIL